MKHNPSKKNKITLSDYPYQEDIQNRILMSQFTVADVEVLEEILLSSLTIHLSNLASNVDRNMVEVMEIVDKLSQTGLCKRVGEVITVDKDVRKYYEFQILKFDDQFEPDMDFLQGLLRKVPIHILPTWYAIPRASSNIFESIVDKYLRTPRIFQRYLLELGFEDPMMQDVFEAPDFEIRSRDLREKYNLSREEFQERMLLLEFSFICCTSYRQIDDEWKEVVTPFHEWREYLRFQRDHKPKALETPIKDAHPRLFAEDFKEALETGKLPEEKAYADWIVAKLPLAEEKREEWLALDPQELGLALYRHPDNPIISVDLPEAYLSEKNFREVEKALSRIETDGWVDFDAFLKGVTANLHTSEEISLQKKGRKWAYVLPTYSEEDKAFIKAAIFERLFEAGLISIGDHALRITPFGRTILSRP